GNVRAQAALRLAELDDPSALEALIRTLDDGAGPNHVDITPAVIALGDMGERAIPAPIEPLSADDEHTRLHAQPPPEGAPQHTAADIRDSASEVRRAGWPAKFACASMPDCTVVVCDAAVAASDRTSAAAAWAVYSRIIAPESGPGSCASCGARPVTSGSSRALTRAATNDADCAIAPRSESSASVSTPAWKFPLGSATPSRGSISAFSPATLSST